MPSVLNPHPRTQQLIKDRDVVSCFSLSRLGSCPVRIEQEAGAPAAASFRPLRGLLVCSRLSLNKPSPGARGRGCTEEAERGAGGSARGLRMSVSGWRQCPENRAKVTERESGPPSPPTRWQKSQAFSPFNPLF